MQPSDLSRNHDYINVNADKLIGFWKDSKGQNLHPSDRYVVDQNRFALDLRPVPWVGPIRNAKIFFLYVNPGLSGEEFECEKRPIFQEKIVSNLCGNQPYLYLLDEISFHPGYRWARKIFGKDTRREHSEFICAVQLVPYHSKKGDYARQVSKNLPSSIMMQQFVLQTLLPRAQRGDIGIVVTRSANYWGISEESENIVVYKFPENVAAYQTKKTRGGKLLRRILNY